MSDSFLI